MAFAHAHGVLHRDRKPANIMVGEFGEVLVMDWGLAKVADLPDVRASVSVAASDSLPGDIAGTPAYMSPEQARGEPLDERADVFSLGAMLYEMLTGRPPYTGEMAWEVLEKAQEGKIEPPAQGPPELTAVAMKAMRREYAGVAGFQADLQAWLEERGVSERRDRRPGDGVEVGSDPPAGGGAAPRHRSDARRIAAGGGGLNAPCSRDSSLLRAGRALHLPRARHGDRRIQVRAEAMNVYVDLTRAFNDGRTRAVLCGGQAAVLHRVAIMSKDGDWILREDEECLAHLLSVLGGQGARYRFGAPLDVRWLSGGWSSHFEFLRGQIRVRADFVTRPPRLDAEALQRLWREQEGRDVPFVGLRDLAELKKTNREKDYAVIGELARMMQEPDARLLYSRSARDLLALASDHPRRVEALAAQRPLLDAIGKGSAELEAALDAERRHLIHANEERLAGYMAGAERWAEQWPAMANEIKAEPLAEAHRLMIGHAEGLLPFRPTGDRS